MLGAVLFLTILACLWHLIVTSGPEIGDFGANSLLVQSAKHFQLLTGNYSRAGFNHPGPALLYVLAAGESLFYDGLHWAPTPLGAQLVTVAIYAAAWLTLLAALVRRLGLSPLEAVAFLTAFAAFAASVEPEVFDGLWFPHLYFLPFAVFTLATTLLIRGLQQAWLPLALSFGFLFNGHVSFIPICGVMVLMALCANLALGRLVHSGDGVTWLSLSGVRRAAPHLILPAVILVLFALPLLIVTVTQFPGPVVKYVSFGRQHSRHGFIQGTVYLLQFWGRQPWQMVISLGSLVILAAGVGRSRFGWPLLIGVGIASMATLVYAVFGIDDYQYSYIAIFYGAVPAVVVGGAVATLLSLLSGWRAAPWLAIASTAACFGLWASAIARPAWYSSQYNVPEVVAISDAIDGLSPRPFVLDFSTATNWPQIQVLMLGVDAYRQRLLGRLGYCIGQNWDLSLGPIQCSESEMLDEPHLLVDTSDTAIAKSFRPAASAGGLSFFKFDPPCLAAGASLSLASDDPAFEHAILGMGWSSGGGDFAWSVGSSSQLHLCLAEGVTALRLDLDAYRPVATSVQTAEVSIAGREVARLRFDGADPGGWRTIPLAGTPSGDLLLTVTVDHPISPQEAEGSPDTRALGLALRGIAAQ